MATSHFESALGSLMKHQDPKRLKKILVELRKGLESPNKEIYINMLYERSCLKQLIFKLQESHEDILNLTLSILSICFTSRACARDAVNKYNLLSYFNHILKHHKRDSIQGKIFRVIGNTCQHWGFANNVLEKESQLHIVSKLVVSLKTYASDDESVCSEENRSRVSETTVGMAIHALRELTNCYTMNKLIKDCQVVKALGMVLIKFSRLEEVKSGQEHILNAVLRLLLHYSIRYRNYDVIVELQNTEMGNTIAHLHKLALISPATVVKFAASLKALIRHKSDLPIAELFQRFMDKLNDASNFPLGRNDLLHRDYLKCICFLMQNDFVHTYKEELVSLGLIPMLIKILRDYVDSNDIACAGGSCCDYVSQYQRNASSDLYSLTKGNQSPSSDTSYSPPSSPALSLSDVEVNPENYETDSDDYSPVCSDSEEEVALKTGNLEEAAADDQEENVEVEQRQEINQPDELKERLVAEIIKLLKLIVIKQPVVKDFNIGDLLIKMLMLLYPWNKSFCPTKTMEVIILFIETPEHLIEIMQSDFVNGAHKFTILPHGMACPTCNELSEIGRTILTAFTKIVDRQCGEGDIAHQLYRGSLAVKQKLVLNIPFVSCNKQTLLNLMISCGGLKIMMEQFKEPEMQQKCISGLYVISLKLGIKNPTFYSDINLVHLFCNVQDYKLEEDCSTVVRFKLDDQSLIEANRTLLSEKSDYFNRLLYGEFKESLEEEVQLCDISNKALKFLLMLLQIDVNTRHVYEFGQSVELEVMLEVISLTDRYLLEDLCVCLTLCVQYLKMSPATVSMIYQWSLESGTNILRAESVAYLLVTCVPEAQRLDMFKNLSELGYSQDLADDIQKILTRFLGYS